MPRLSKKAKLQNELSKLLQARKAYAFLRKHILDDSESDDDSDNEEDEFNDIIDKQVSDAVTYVSSHRYVFRSEKYRCRSRFFDWKDCLSDESIRFNDTEFLKTFRVSRKNFWHLVSLVDQNEVFRNMEKKRRKAPVSWQILVFLYRLGRQGSDGSDLSIGTYFGIGSGTVRIFVGRVLIAVKELKDEIVFWPDNEERADIKRRIKVKHGFQNCIGIIDGTLLGLAFKPSRFGESYFCRKHIYAINIQILCDDKGKIRYYYGGWPGSTHDNRAWRNSKPYLHAEDYFDNGEYLLGDSAYSACSVIVATFKTSSGSSLGPHKEFFNKNIAPIRVVSEHCNGILKNRFCCLKNINIDAGPPEGVKEIMDIFECCCILHNIFIEYDDDIPAEWYEDIDSNHYWTVDDDDSLIVNGAIENFDRREAVYRAFINDYYI